MAKPKFNLKAAPTFKAKVAIPVPGGDDVEIEFTFKHRTRDEFKDFVEKLKDREDLDVIEDITSGWDLEDAFSKANLKELNQNYIGSGRAIISTYVSELTSAREKN